jgi:exopolyphosphatase/guanosine-5'-triphosphate,3'-diphosphate pyrophosphatase
LLFAFCFGDWGLNSSDRDFLGGATRLHETGLSVVHTQYNKHDQYLVEHSDLQGFNRSEQKFLGLLVRGHRQKFPMGEFKNFSSMHSLRLKDSNGIN